MAETSSSRFAEKCLRNHSTRALKCFVFVVSKSFFLPLFMNWLYFRVISICISLYAIVILSAGFSRWCCEVKTSGRFQEKNTFSRLFPEIKPFWMELIPGWVTTSLVARLACTLGEFTHEKPSTYSLRQSWRIPVSMYWSNCKCLCSPWTDCCSVAWSLLALCRLDPFIQLGGGRGREWKFVVKGISAITRPVLFSFFYPSAGTPCIKVPHYLDWQKLVWGHLVTLIETSMQLTTCISGYDQNGGLFEQHSISFLSCFVFLSIYLFIYLLFLFLFFFPFSL